MSPLIFSFPVMYAIVFAMTVKPTTDDGLVLLVGAAILVALSAFFLSRLRAETSAADAPADASA
jgi:hypothetical protein